MRSGLVGRLRGTAKLAAAVVVTVVLFFPIYWMLQTAITPTSKVLSRHPQLVPTPSSVTLDGFSSLLHHTSILTWFLNSAIITIGSAVLSSFAAVLAGYGLSRFKVRGSRGIAYVLLLGRVLPGTLLALPFFVMFRWTGLLDSRLSVILANMSLAVPFATFLMLNYFSDIPRDLDDAARVDGCSSPGVLWRIVLPLAMPGIAATMAFAATASWVDLLFARTLLLTQHRWTIPVGIASLLGDVQTNWNQLMAAGTLSVVPVLVVYWFIQPYLVSGMTVGAVKG